MKFNLSATGVLMVLGLVLGAFSPLPAFADQVTTPVAHSGPGYDADAGICWAFALSGLMESEAIKRGQNVSLSAEYLGFYNLVTQIKNDLHLYKDLSKIPSLFRHTLAQNYVKRALDPQVGSNQVAAMAELKNVGIVPNNVYSYTFFAVQEGSSTLADRLLEFAETKLIDPVMNAKYMSDSDALIDDLSIVYDGKPVPKPTDNFMYEGKQYNALTFLSSYLAFNPDDYETVQYAHAQLPVALQLIQKALHDNTAVPIGFLLVGDQGSIENSGIFSCSDSDCSNMTGGHAVLVVSSLVNTSGSTDALIIENDWGNLGLNDLGEPSSDISQLGFFQLTEQYLYASTGAANMSVTVPKRYLSK